MCMLLVERHVCCWLNGMLQVREHAWEFAKASAL